MKTRLESLTEQYSKLKEVVDVLVPRKVERNLLQDDGTIKEWTEEFSNAEEYLESERKFMKMLYERQGKKLVKFTRGGKKPLIDEMTDEMKDEE